MNFQRLQLLENPSPATVALLLILSITLFALADFSARAGRADAWVMLCGQCQSLDARPAVINSSLSQPVISSRLISTR